MRKKRISGGTHDHTLIHSLRRFHTCTPLCVSSSMPFPFPSTLLVDPKQRQIKATVHRASHPGRGRALRQPVNQQQAHLGSALCCGQAPTLPTLAECVLREQTARAAKESQVTLLGVMGARARHLVARLLQRTAVLFLACIAGAGACECDMDTAVSCLDGYGRTITLGWDMDGHDGKGCGGSQLHPQVPSGKWCHVKDYTKCGGTPIYTSTGNCEPRAGLPDRIYSSTEPCSSEWDAHSLRTNCFTHAPTRISTSGIRFVGGVSHSAARMCPRACVCVCASFL